ncbi:blast:Guanylate cyclase soluble subunit beta-1 [Drosophila guanche]|uniref:Blast:Guanylate cyclase soluble subunit beta-1 n=1 Tax=Drosophila guanche TaxID=7266 RepID=A0A3B0JER9_DROGU|nr:blast:Guanylate cyclase soluble subunit beta-1 [Drosophila guanche]
MRALEAETDMRPRLLCQTINQDDSFHLEYRGPVIMKGKPTPMDCWFLTRATSSLGASGSGATAGGNGSLDSPLLQPTTPTGAPGAPGASSQRLGAHTSISRTSSAGPGGAASASPLDT